MRRFLMTLGLAAAVTSPSGAHAQEWMTTPVAATGKMVKVGRATVSLPPGDWQELAVQKVAAGGTMQDYGGAQSEAKIFVLYDKGQTSGVLYIYSNIGTTLTYRTPDACMRKDTIIVDIVSTDKFNYNCLIINHTVTIDPSVATGLNASLYPALQAHGGIPNVWLGATFYLAGQTQFDYLSVTVLRDVRRDGFNDPKTAWGLSSWHRSNITPDRMAVAQKLLAWSKSYRVTLLHDFRGE